MKGISSSLLLLLLLAHSITTSNCTCVDNILSAGIFFRCELSVQDLEFSITQGTIASSSVRQEGYAGAPTWVQSAVDSDGGTVLLYGTPAEQDTGTLQLLVTALRDDFTVSVVSIQLIVRPLEGQVLHYSEFYVTNFNMEEVLVGARYSVLTLAVSEVYSGSDPVVLAFIDPQDRGIVIPPPPAKLGVLVQVTPGLNLKDTSQEGDTLEGCEVTHVAIFSSRGFGVTMCQYRLQYSEETSNTSQTTPPVGVVMPSPKESSVTLIVIVVVVGVAVSIALSIFTCIFFCKRRFASTLTKSRRRDNATLLHHTNSSVLEVNKAQVVLRSLSSAATPKVTTPPTWRRPQSTETCLEYQDAPSESFDEAPPNYQYNEELLRNNSSSTPST